jgi:hypothetical protein
MNPLKARPQTPKDRSNLKTAREIQADAQRGGICRETSMQLLGERAFRDGILYASACLIGHRSPFFRFSASRCFSDAGGVSALVSFANETQAIGFLGVP